MSKELNVLDDNRIITIAWVMFLFNLLNGALIQIDLSLSKLITASGIWVIAITILSLIYAIVVNISAVARNFIMEYFGRAFVTEYVLYFFGSQLLFGGYKASVSNLIMTTLFLGILSLQIFAYFWIERRKR